jgi:hypothetical protein
MMRLFIYLTCAGLMTLVIGCQPRHFATDACNNNLRQIDGAKQQWMVEQHKTTNDLPTWDDMREYIGGRGTTGQVITCPAGGTYTLGRVGEKPTCSIGRHRL